MHEKIKCDVLVVGARCAGAATAMLMARQGLKVLAVERGSYGTDTISTHALMRGGVLQLHRWGLLPRLLEVGTPEVRTTCFHYDHEVVEIAVKPSHGVDALYAPRRTVLDSLLVDATQEAGAEIRHRHTLTALTHRADGRVSGGTILGPEGKRIEVEAGLVVGADGTASAVARLAGADTLRMARHTSAVVYGHWSDIGMSGYHWYYRKGVSAGVIPTNAGRHCVFVSVPPERFRNGMRHDLTAGYRSALVEISAELAASVTASRLETQLWTFPGRKGYLRQPRGPGWALVGDAGYFKDPLTAHGITDALRDAELVAKAAVRGSDAAFADFAAVRDELSLPLFDATEAIASFGWDIARIKEHHQALNKTMKRETDYLAERGVVPAAAKQASAVHQGEYVP